MENNVEWISAKDALAKIDPRVQLDVKRNIADHLRDGTLTAFANQAWISETTLLSKAWREPNKIGLQTALVIPKNFFRADKRWVEDQARWRWPASCFSVTIGLKPIRRRMFSGVKFNATQFEKIFGPTPNSRGGRPPRNEAWIAFFHEVIKIAASGDLTYGNFRTQRSLADEILKNFSGGLEYETIKPAVAQIYKKFVTLPPPVKTISTDTGEVAD